MSIAGDVAELVKKNCRNLLRSKAGSLVVILGPLLVVFLAGLAFDNSNIYSVKVGVFNPDNSSTTTRFIEKLDKEFKIQEFYSEKDCVSAVRDTDTTVCMVFVPDFSVGIPPRNQITFYIDYSRMNLVWAVRNAMTGEIGEESLKASENLTGTLLSVIEFTQKEIVKERDALVRLSTENELMNQNAKDLLAELGDIDLTLDNELPLANLSSSRTQLRQWVENSLELGNKGLGKAVSAIDAADKIVKASGGSETLIANFKASVDDIRSLQADMITSQNLTKDAFERFDAQFSVLISGIETTKAKLDEADTSRQLSLRVIESVRLLLDQSLLNVLEVQKSLNDIDRQIRAIEITDANAISQPIVTTIKPIVQEKTYLNYLFPVLIVLVLMFTALLISPTLILLDKKSPASFRSFMTPVKDMSYVIADFVTSFLILAVQAVIIMAIVRVFFSITLQSLPFTVFLLILISAFFVLLGMIVGYSFNSEETATLAGVSVGALFLFVSDVIIPLESMPEVFGYIASFNPYVLGSSLLRRSMIFNSPITAMAPDTLVLLLYVVFFAFIAAGAFLITKGHSLQELAYTYAPKWIMTHLPRKK